MTEVEPSLRARLWFLMRIWWYEHGVRIRGSTLRPSREILAVILIVGGYLTCAALAVTRYPNSSALAVAPILWMVLVVVILFAGPAFEDDYDDERSGDWEGRESQAVRQAEASPPD